MIEEVSTSVEMKANISCIGDRKETDLPSSSSMPQTDRGEEVKISCADADIPPRISTGDTKEAMIRDFKRQLTLAERIETIDKNGRELLENLANILNALILDQQVPPSTPPKQLEITNRRLPSSLRVSMEDKESSTASPITGSMPVVNGRS
jgi:hypothetical protein